MNVPLRELGLARFLVVYRHGMLLFEEGKPCPEAVVGSSEGLLQVALSEEEVSESIVDLRLLSRALLPTLPEHTLDSLCAHYEIVLKPGREKEAIGALFIALIAEGLTFERDLVSLLSQLLPDATGALLGALVPWVNRHEPPCQEEPARGPEDQGVPSLKEVLSKEGIIGRGLTAFEDRLGQKQMAQLACQTFEKGGTLVIEAGAGTGKTFAYLIPALLHLRSHDRARLVVSTRTKQLQEQLYAKDLPFLVSRLHPHLKAALLKGRENYLCLRRWQRVLGELTEGLEQDLLASLAPLASWLFRTQTGDIEENSVFLTDPNGITLWSRLRDDPRHCPGPVCPFFDECFSIAARRRAKGADLVVVNHSLLLADLVADHGIIGEYSYLIVDEAHALEKAARQAMTSTLAAYSLAGLLAEIHQPARHRVGGWLARLPLPRTDPQIEQVRSVCEALHGMNVRLFTALAETLPAERRGRLPLLADLRPQIERITQTVAQLASLIETIGETLEEADVRQEAEGMSAEAEAIGSLLVTLFSPEQDNMVHWYERKEGTIALHTSPLEVAPVLKQALYPKLDGLILTSATLSLGRGFTYLRKSLGLDAAPEKATYSVVPVPFSYRERMRLYIAEFLPPADGPVKEYAEGLATLVGQLATATQRTTLILFTSYQLLRAVHERLPAGLITYAQGIDGPRSKVLERFRNHERGAILLGTDSFWEGVDLPGKDLEILIITRLPFSVPTDPILSALAEQLARVGRDPFNELFVPLAILRLRQGLGRLIRTRSDRGAVILTDRRILYKSYGPLFTDALPVSAQRTTHFEDLLRDLSTWLEDPLEDLSARGGKGD